MKNQIPIAVTIPALANGVPGFFSQPTHGRIFTCTAATAAFQVRVDSGAVVDLDVGRSIGDESSQEFGRLGFYNNSANAIVVTGIVSDEPYKTDTVVNSSVSVTSTNKNADTYTKSTGVVALLSGTSVNFTGLDGVKKRRQFVVRNRAGSVGTLDIKAADGNVMDTLSPGDPPWTLETNSGITLTAVGGDVNYTFAASFYS